MGIVIHPCQDSNVSWGQCKFHMGNCPRLSPICFFSWLILLYNFPVLTHDSEYNSFQWVLFILLVNYHTWGLFGETHVFTVDVKSDDVTDPKSVCPMLLKAKTQNVRCQLRRRVTQIHLTKLQSSGFFYVKRRENGRGCLRKTAAPPGIPLMVRSYYLKGHKNTAGLYMITSKTDLEFYSVTRTVFGDYSLRPCSLVKSALPFDKLSLHPRHHNLVLFLLLIVHSTAISFLVIFLLTLIF